MANQLQMPSLARPAVSLDRERELTMIANRLVDAIHADCQGDLGEMAFVFSHAPTSVLRSCPSGTGGELLTRLSHYRMRR